jgi:tRNA (mo5U34)-methyltransferase
VPARLDGSRVLDIAPWNGFFGFECLRRGARELVALGPEDPDVTGFARTVQLLEITDKVHYIQGSVYDIRKLCLGKFDIVLFLGLIYHLRHPLLAIDLLHDHCDAEAMFLIDSPLANRVAHVAEPDKAGALKPAWEAIQHIPIAMFVRGGADVPLARDPFNWFIPNEACLGVWLASSGFEIIHHVTAGNWCSMRARPVERPFADGLEGFNPRAPLRGRQV